MQEDHPFKGIQKNKSTVDGKLILEQLRGRVLELRKAKYEDILLQNPRVKFIQGTGRLIHPNKVSVKSSEEDPIELNPTKILIATGSSPTIPNIEGLYRSTWLFWEDQSWPLNLPKRFHIWAQK